MNFVSLLEIVKDLSLSFGPSGHEKPVRDRIISYIDGVVPYHIDPLGNLIVEKKGKTTPSQRIMIDAHMDEVGMIITSIGQDGLLSFSAIGGILPEALLGKTVTFGSFDGVIGCVPVHCLSGEKKNILPSISDMYIDIGVATKEQAKKLVQPGDVCTFKSDFVTFGDGYIKGKALDDRIGCAVLLDYILKEQEFDTICTFTVQEEVGLVGAKTATFGVLPDIALVLEATTAADIAGVPENEQVCKLGEGVAVSFMDRSTIYDRELFQTVLAAAKSKRIPCQTKNAVAGGNNAGAIHSALQGVRTLALSVPCRYLHSAGCVVCEKDILATSELLQAMVNELGTK
ncbi:MAG: M42 family peptidase [Clostridia bacterium]|nr:M42 family peptidase [Clostridia bacterium]